MIPPFFRLMEPSSKDLLAAPLIKFRKNGWVPHQIKNTHLSIGFSPTTFQLLGLDTSKNQCLFLEEYTIPPNSNSWNLLKSIHHQHPFLIEKQWEKVSLLMSHEGYTFLPKAYCTEETMRRSLALTSPLQTDENIHYTGHSHYAMNLIFAVPQSLKENFQFLYPHTDIRILHQASCLLNGYRTILKQHYIRQFPIVLVYVSQEYFTITILQKDQLTFHNSFPYDSSNTLLYYLLITMDTLGIPREKHAVFFWGHIQPDGIVYRKACNYLSHVSMGPTFAHLKLPSGFPASTLSLYFPLLSSYLDYESLPL